LARFFGGIILGAAADSYGRKTIVIISLSVMSTLTLISAFLPSIHDVPVDWALAVMISFITLRIVIGFFVGGICLDEEIKKRKKLDEEKSFEEEIKKHTIASAIMQSGFHSGHLIAAFVSLGLLVAFGITWHGWPVTVWHSSYFSFKDAFTWRTLSFFGGYFGIIWADYFSNSEKNERETSDIYRKIKSPLKALLNNRENEEYRSIRHSSLFTTSEERLIEGKRCLNVFLEVAETFTE
jgi:MFS family permease